MMMMKRGLRSLYPTFISPFHFIKFFTVVYRFCFYSTVAAASAAAGGADADALCARLSGGKVGGLVSFGFQLGLVG